MEEALNLSCERLLMMMSHLKPKLESLFFLTSLPSWYELRSTFMLLHVRLVSDHTKFLSFQHRKTREKNT
jgi:hypothetical protein